MKRLIIYIAAALIGVMIFTTGCERKKQLSREEIPAIKTSLVAIENVIKAYNADYVDSLLSDDADNVGTTAQGVLDFVYGDDLSEFVGFTHKQIYYRGDAARVDAKISGPDGPVRDVSITLRKQEGEWYLKKIEPQIEDPEEDTLDIAGDAANATPSDQ